MNLILTGTAGSGKTTVGNKLAARLGAGWRFDDADDFHPPANVAKMRSGRPLDDASRGRYLKAPLLRSQFETLEEPAPGAALVIDASLAPDVIVAQIFQETGVPAQRGASPPLPAQPSKRSPSLSP